MAWLLRLVVVLVTWAAGSAENVIDMKVVVFYPLTLCAPYRLLHIASTVNADVLLLPGTGLRCSCDGPLTNSSAGCAIVLRRRWFSRDDVKKVCFPHVITPANVAYNATARINWKVARVLQRIPSKEVRDHVPIFFYLHCNWYGSWKSIQVEREQWDDKLAACLQHGTDWVPFLESLQQKFLSFQPAIRAVLKGVPRHPVRCLLGPCRYSLRSLGIEARQAVCPCVADARARPWSSSCICVRCFGFLDLSTRFCHKCGHPELEAVPDTFHGREIGAQKNVSCCEALRSQDEEAGNVFWGWARSKSAQIKAAACLEKQLGGRDGVGPATFSRTELLGHRGTAVRNSDGAAPSKFVGSIIHTVASTVSDPSIIRKMNWKLISNSKYVEKHFRHG